MNDWKDTGFSTRSVHAGQGVDEGSGAIRRSIVMANSDRWATTKA